MQTVLIITRMVPWKVIMKNKWRKVSLPQIQFTWIKCVGMVPKIEMSKTMEVNLDRSGPLLGRNAAAKLPKRWLIALKTAPKNWVLKWTTLSKTSKPVLHKQGTAITAMKNSPAWSRLPGSADSMEQKIIRSTSCGRGTMLQIWCTVLESNLSLCLRKITIYSPSMQCWIWGLSPLHLQRSARITRSTTRSGIKLSLTMRMEVLRGEP